MFVFDRDTRNPAAVSEKVYWWIRGVVDAGKRLNNSGMEGFIIDKIIHDDVTGRVISVIAEDDSESIPRLVYQDTMLALSTRSDDIVLIHDKARGHPVAIARESYVRIRKYYYEEADGSFDKLLEYFIDEINEHIAEHTIRGILADDTGYMLTDTYHQHVLGYF